MASAKALKPRGPSPCVWGEPRSPRRVNRGQRTISTCVWRTLLRVDVHTLEQGPSPRAWGELAVEPQEDRRFRTIPTCVGRTSAAGAVGEFFPDHPHVRGENGGSPYYRATYTGPSPRAWGERRRLPGALKIGNTIPTCVGRTAGRWSCSPTTSDHPHVRGENLQELYNEADKHGPSPRAWGEPGELSEKTGYRRTIPTCVGRTRPHASATRRSADHPHVRGENFAF